MSSNQTTQGAGSLPPLTLSRREEVRLPHDSEIERIVLGALLLREDPAQVIETRRELHGSAFMLPSHRDIFDCLVEMAEEGAVNYALLMHQLKARGSSVNTADVSSLIDGVPRLSDLSAEIRIIKEAATRRDIIRAADSWITKAQERDVDVRELSRAIADRGAAFGQTSVKQAKQLSVSWATLCEMKIERREQLLHETERGEVVMSSAITNRGKTTFWRNVVLSQACGREFLPLVKAGPPRVILYLDFETRLYRSQGDINKMLQQFDKEERALVAQNFHLICDCRIDERPLTLSNPRHLEILEEEARKLKVDVLIIDTLTAAFEIENENDNSEAARVMKKITGLAQRLNCVVVFLHHVGKAKQEEGQTAHAVHRARGGSAYSGFSPIHFNLLPDPMIRERVTLECGKVKGPAFENTIMNLDPATRWFSAAGVVVKQISPYDQVIGIFNGKPLGISDLEGELPEIPISSLKRHLKTAIETGDLMKAGHGKYRKVSKSHPYRDDTFDTLPESLSNESDSQVLSFEGKNRVETFENPKNLSDREVI